MKDAVYAPPYFLRPHLPVSAMSRPVNFPYFLCKRFLAQIQIVPYECRANEAAALRLKEPVRGGGGFAAGVLFCAYIDSKMLSCVNMRL